MKISALITNYNTWPLTRRCAQALDHWSSEDLVQILVVDDASSGNPPVDLSEKVRVIHNEHNLGYVASVNVGFSQLSEDVVILLDSDAYPLMDLAKPIAQIFAAAPNLGALGFRLVGQDGCPTGSSQIEPNAFGLLLGQRMEALHGRWFKSLQSERLCLHSCGMAVRRSAFNDIGGFDEEFDFLDADTDFSMRLHTAGWQVHVNPTLVAFHEGGGSFQTTATRVLRHHRNRWRLLAKHQRLPHPAFFKLGLAMRHLCEYGTLHIIGRWLITESAKLQDKISGRRQLLREVWSGYGNEF
ncbi:MAG: glycosyltransferase family 2 protein [Leptolyngbyaceae cyanobacterium MO_188.B28]|nr:glycosyltransferase family 2 protein [Leptolyngbyaceae cyanobacterium MO_188.B28]